jgi:Tol biopolymer transport system component
MRAVMEYRSAVHWHGLIFSMICLLLVGHGAQPIIASDTTHYRVVFESRRNGAFASTAFSVKPDGSDETQLSRHKSGRPLILDPRVSWDGTLMAFTRGGSNHRTGVWIMNSDGTGEREIIAEVAIRFEGGWAMPSLSPDNKEMVYVSNLDGRDDIYRTSIEAKKPIRLTTKGDQNRLPRWSPDGKWIAYASKQGQNRNIVLMRPDGSESRAITTSDSDDTMPAWLPDSKGLVFVSDRDGPTEIYSISLTGREVRRLSNTVDFHELHPAVSPDGSMIAFEAKPADAPSPWMKSIYVMPFEGGPAVQLTSSRHSDNSPTWIPDLKR